MDSTNNQYNKLKQTSDNLDHFKEMWTVDEKFLEENVKIFKENATPWLNEKISKKCLNNFKLHSKVLMDSYK